MPQPIEQLLKESKELIELSRALRARSLQATKKSADVMRRSDSLSDKARKIMWHFDDLRSEKLFAK